MESLSPREPARSRDGRPFSLCRRATSEARHHELLKQASEHRRRLPAKHSGLAQGNGKCPALASLSAVHAWSQDNLQRCIDHLVGCQRVCTSHKAVKTSASLIEPMVVDTPRRDAFNTTTTRAMGKRVAVLPDCEHESQATSSAQKADTGLQTRCSTIGGSCGWPTRH